MCGNLVIRSDAGLVIGDGHLRRCLTLGQAWSQAGGQVYVMSCNPEQRMRNMINELGFEFIEIIAPHPNHSDANSVAKFVNGLADIETRPVWLAMDGYHFDFEYQSALDVGHYRTLIIDDYAHHDAYTADFLLNQNVGAEELRSRYTQVKVFLAGTEYALLRPEFPSAKRSTVKIASVARRVLLAIGGGESRWLTARVINELNLIGNPLLEIKVVIGPTTSDRDNSIEAQATSSRHQVELLNHVNDMASLMSWADVAIAAAGSTTLELACLGVPTILITVAENQIMVAKEMDSRGAAIDLGRADKLHSGAIAGTLTELLNSRERRLSLSAKSSALVDGNGAARVVDRMLAYRRMGELPTEVLEFIS